LKKFYQRKKIRHLIEKVPCIDEKGRENHVLVMHIDASLQVHANQADDVSLRVGDKSKLQTFEE
jgi:ATP-dependent DNA helicase RecG